MKLSIVLSGVFALLMSISSYGAEKLYNYSIGFYISNGTNGDICVSSSEPSSVSGYTTAYVYPTGSIMAGSSGSIVKLTVENTSGQQSPPPAVIETTLNIHQCDSSSSQLCVVQMTANIPYQAKSTNFQVTSGMCTFGTTANIYYPVPSQGTIVGLIVQ